MEGRRGKECGGEEGCGGEVWRRVWRKRGRGVEVRRGVEERGVEEGCGGEAWSVDEGGV